MITRLTRALVATHKRLAPSKFGSPISGHRRPRTQYAAIRATGEHSTRRVSRTVCARCLHRLNHGFNIAACAGRLKVGRIQSRLNAIVDAHKAVGLESPTHHAMVTNTMKGIRRTKGTAPAQKAPTLTDDIRAMVDASDIGLIGTRDSALLLLGFAGAFRRSELVGLDMEDCAFGKDGLTVTLRRSKTDQESAGRKIGIPYGSNPETCPVRNCQAWIEQAGIATGPLFKSLNRHGQVQEGRLSGIDVARVVKKLCGAGGTRSGEVRGTFTPRRSCD